MHFICNVTNEPIHICPVCCYICSMLRFYLRINHVAICVIFRICYRVSIQFLLRSVQICPYTSAREIQGILCMRRFRNEISKYVAEQFYNRPREISVSHPVLRFFNNSSINILIGIFLEGPLLMAK